MILKYILTFVCCLPVWAGVIWLFGKVSAIYDFIENASDFRFYQFVIMPIIGTFCAIVIPIMLIALGIAAWCLFEWLWNII